MNKLISMIEELENYDKQKNTEQVVKQLQTIEKELLMYYEIVVEGIIIKPLLIEAYFKSNNFNDTNVHCDDNQQKGLINYGKPYFHKEGYGGIDICLSRGNYYLSFLIKNSLVTYPYENNSNIEDHQSFMTQVPLYENFKEKNRDDFELKFKPSGINESYCTFSKRKGLKQKDDFYEKELAVVSLSYFKDFKLTFATGCGKEDILKKYLQDYHKNESREEWEKISENILGYKLKSFFDSYFN